MTGGNLNMVSGRRIQGSSLYYSCNFFKKLFPLPTPPTTPSPKKVQLMIVMTLPVLYKLLGGNERISVRLMEDGWGGGVCM